MEIQCPKCDQRIGSDDVNVANDIAFCRSCNEAFSLSDAMGAAEFDDVDFANPPRGVSISDAGNRLVLTATTRSPSGWFFLFFSGFWNTIVSIFLVTAIAGAIKGEDSFDGPFPGFIFVFLIPFVLVGIGTAIAALMGLFGTMRVTLEHGLLTVFTGLLGIGRTKVIDWGAATGVRVADSGVRSNNQAVMHIEVDGPKPVKFGLFLSEERRQFIAAVLHRMLSERGRG
jgi:hypothetical protein